MEHEGGLYPTVLLQEKKKEKRFYPRMTRDQERVSCIYEEDQKNEPNIFRIKYEDECPNHF